MCSMREKCQNLTFKVRSEEQKNRTNSVKVTFRCLDHTSTSIDICKPCTVFSNDTLYLTATGDSARLYNMCECFVNLDEFSIKAADVRLDSIQEKKCTDAVVHINSKEFKCDPDKDSFDSVFNRTVATSVTNAFISLLPKSSTEFPSMILITVNPKRTARLVCIPKPSRPGAVILSAARTTRPMTTYSVEQVSSTNTVTHKDTERSSSTCNSNYGRPFLPAFLVTLALLVAGTLTVFIFRKRRRFKMRGYYKTRENGKESEKYQSSVTLKSVSTSSREGPPPISDEPDRISEDSKSISSKHSDIVSNSYTSSSYKNPLSFRDNIILVPSHTAPKKSMFDQVDTATEYAWGSLRNPMAEEEKNHDNDEGTPVCPYGHKPHPLDESENDFML